MTSAAQTQGGTKTVVVTGASVGIGAVSARVFAAAGWKVVALARGPCPVPGAVSVVADFQSPCWEREAAPQLMQHVLPGVVCVVHNAALLLKDDALALSAERLREVFEVNVVVPAVLNRLLAPLMQSGSSILYVGSTLSEKAVKNTASYVASKHAVVGLMRATCQDAAPRGIHTACVCPGFVDTDMLRVHSGGSPEVMAEFAAMSGHNRLVQPEEIAALLLFCAGQPSIDGAVIHMNLGQIQH